MKRPVLWFIQNGALAALAGASLYLAIQQSLLTSEVQKRPYIEQFTHLQEHVDRVDSLLDDLRNTSLASLDQLQENDQNLQERLEKLNQAHQQYPDVEGLQHDLAELSADVQSMQAHMQTLKMAIDHRSLTPSPSQAIRPLQASGKQSQAHKKVPPPFNILAVDFRGGELFLAVSPVGSTQLNSVELLRPSHSYMGWKLDALAPGEARFDRPDGSRFTVRVRER